MRLFCGLNIAKGGNVKLFLTKSPAILKLILATVFMYQKYENNKPELDVR